MDPTNYERKKPAGPRLGAGGEALIALRIAAALCVARLVTPLSLPLFVALGSEYPNPFHETGDIRIRGALLAMIVFYGGLCVLFAAAALFTYFLLGRLATRPRAVASLILLATLAVRSDPAGRFSLKPPVDRAVRGMFRPPAPAPPFSRYESPPKEKEIRREGSQRMRVEWIGDKLRVTNRTPRDARIRVDFFGSVNHNSRVNCGGDREPDPARLPLVPANSVYTTERIVCGNGFAGYAFWAWNDAGELISHQESRVTETR